MPRDDDDDRDDRDDRDDDRRDDRDDRDDDRRERDEHDRDRNDAATDVQVRPMPLRLYGAIIASIFWGGLLLYGSCVHFSHSVLGVIAVHNAQVRFGRFGGDFGEGFFGTLAAAQFFMVLLAGALLAAGILLMMRKGFARWMAMAVPGAMVLLDLFTAVICLIITSGTFLAQHNFDFLIDIVFNLAIGGCNAYLLLNKDVAKALK
jgi:hypothetical protein